ncbi:M20 family metallopeptidase [Jeotgalibacillus soli]|uniref:Carboxypeptidase n=1 Tax=Jeotgalibacillus soli TaxID=889306 RepID=A0A0C2RS72_9BACL|nr:M20 family metallopeptidase [Jeotgalibacillus soli]KIL44594.1 carboxypeptidase [Jeotgalibacillus soli]
MERYIKQKNEEMISLLEKIVNIDSGTYIKKGVDRIGTILSEKYKELGFEIVVDKQEEYGNHLIIQHKEAVNPKIILVAHMDTVFPKGTADERPFHIDGNRAYGPGVVDMKGSQVELLYAIKALKEKNDKSYQNVQIILNGDEEIGSITSRSLIEKHAKGKEYALIMEPARKDGSLVSARKGGGRFTLTVEGIAAHSGIEPEKGRSAIEELAHKIIQLHELNDHESGITVNVGIIEGGSSVNTISPHAVAEVDIRISKAKQADQVRKEIEEICSHTDVPGTKVEVSGEITRLPMEKNEQTKELLAIIKKVGKEVGVEVKDTFTGGGSDASYTSAAGVATIDGLGPVGGDPHSENEYLELDTLTERTHMLAKIIQRLSREYNKENK